ncbi:MAG: Rrf2 family transcriptional regulator [Oligoflexia bacterium]|nr:Rrf2 family transcriptional regulator [Oligoflexia bacterium]
MLSPQSKYALRAMIYLSKHGGDKFLRVEQIAQSTNLPAPFLSKILKQLVQSKIILSRRGKNGGVMLNPQCSDPSFHHVCLAVGEPLLHAECVLFKRACNKRRPCAFHHSWSNTKARLIEFLQRTRLSSHIRRRL